MFQTTDLALEQCRRYGRAVHPPPNFGLLRILLEHHVKTRQPAIMGKGIIMFKDISSLKFSPFFAKMLATYCCTLM